MLLLSGVVGKPTIGIQRFFGQYPGYAALKVSVAAFVIEHYDPLLYKLPLTLNYVLLQSVVVVLLKHAIEYVLLLSGNVLFL